MTNLKALSTLQNFWIHAWEEWWCWWKRGAYWDECCLLNVRLLEDMHQSFIRVSILLSVAVWMKFWKFAYILRESRLHPSCIQLQKAKYMYPYSNSKWNILMFTCNLYFGCYVFPLIANPYTHSSVVRWQNQKQKYTIYGLPLSNGIFCPSCSIDKENERSAR